MRSLNCLLDTRKMSKIVLLLFGTLDIVFCEIRTNSEMSASEIEQVSSCTDSPHYRLSNAYKTRPRDLSFLSHPNSPDYVRQRSNLQQRTYYGSYDTSASPAYYHAFNPISVLASLAFLAFLLQSFASLFERSRSILPTIVSGRQATIPEISGHVSRALGEYEILNEDSQRK